MATESASQVSGTVKKSDLILFTFQISLVFLICMCSLVNLTLGVGNQNLWTALLTSCLGYIMPNPKIKVINGHVEVYKRPVKSTDMKTPENGSIFGNSSQQ